MKNHIELLAPAGGYEQLKAAVYSGADAVYFGGDKFSSRSKANNFTIEDIVKARRLTRKYKVKMYCAINTLIKDEEINEAINYVEKLYKLGIDALIIQDIGLINLVREYYPDFEIHSSTQLSIQNSYGLKFLKNLGIKRAVLPREVSLKDLETLAKEEIDLEMFVHGAICISFSGQCLISSMIGGRSGNRGSCAQPCRLKYQLIDYRSKKNFSEISASYLSPKDMMLIEHMEELIKLGVTSFKIEGRMKTPEYVSAVVKYYREAIDKVLKSEKFILTKEKKDEMSQVFSRDFTAAYLYGEDGQKLMNINKPNHRGVFLGRVKNYAGGKIEVLLKSDLELGDKLAVWTTKEGRINFSVERIMLSEVKVEKASKDSLIVLDIPKRVNMGDRIFKISSMSLTKELNEVFKENKNDEKIPLTVKVKGKVGAKLKIEFLDDEGHYVQVFSDDILEKADKHPLTVESFIKQMRFGDTQYYLTEIQLETEEVMVPKSVLNFLRRKAVEKLLLQKEEIKFNKISLPSLIESKEEKILTKITIKVDNIEKLKTAFKMKVSYVAIPLFGFRSLGDNFAGILEYFSKLKEEDLNRIIFELPRIIREEELNKVIERINSAKKFINNFAVHTLDQIQLLKELDIENIHGTSSLNIFNSISVKFFRENCSLKKFEYSNELNISQLRKILKGGQLQVFGTMELMILEHCIPGAQLGTGSCKKTILALKDRLDFEFPILVDELGKNHILNSKILMLTDEMAELKKLGFNSFILNFVFREIEELLTVGGLYQKYLEDKIDTDSLRESLNQNMSNYTKGHYNRGVL